MGRARPLAAGLLLFATIIEASGQTNLYSFTANDGKFYHHIRIVRVDDKGILYTFDEGAGGGRLSFSDLPETILDELRSRKIIETSFAEGFAPESARSNLAAAANSNRGPTGEKSDSATLVLSNELSRAVCTFSRKVSSNNIAYLIGISYYGSNYLGLGDADSLTFKADGAMVTYSPAPGTHHVDASGAQLTEAQIYTSSLRDLEKICGARTLNMELAGPLGSANFTTPSGGILREFGRYCQTNASSAAAQLALNAGTATGAATTINFMPREPEKDQPAEVLEATARTLDDDAYTTHWTWSVTLRASKKTPRQFLLDFQFLDADGYTVAHDLAYPVKLTGGETNTLTGKASIQTALSGRIKTCKVVMK